MHTAWLARARAALLDKCEKNQCVCTLYKDMHTVSMRGKIQVVYNSIDLTIRYPPSAASLPLAPQFIHSAALIVCTTCKMA